MKRLLLSLSGLLWLSSALAETIENGKAICEDAERFIHNVGEMALLKLFVCRHSAETTTRSPLSS